MYAEADDWRAYSNAAAQANWQLGRDAAQNESLFVADLGSIGVQYAADVNAAFLAAQTIIHGAYTMYVNALGPTIVNWHQYVETARVAAIVNYYSGDPDIAGITPVALANANYDNGLAQFTATTLNSLAFVGVGNNSPLVRRLGRVNPIGAVNRPSPRPAGPRPLCRSPSSRCRWPRSCGEWRRRNRR